MQPGRTRDQLVNRPLVDLFTTLSLSLLTKEGHYRKKKNKLGGYSRLETDYEKEHGAARNFNPIV